MHSVDRSLTDLIPVELGVEGVEAWGVGAERSLVPPTTNKITLAECGSVGTEEGPFLGLESVRASETDMEGLTSIYQ